MGGEAQVGRRLRWLALSLLCALLARPAQLRAQSTQLQAMLQDGDAAYRAQAFDKATNKQVKFTFIKIKTFAACTLINKNIIQVNFLHLFAAFRTTHPVLFF